MALKRWKLIEAREKAGLSQEELAEELETTRVSISHWENAVTKPHPHFKRKLEDRFGIARGPLLVITDEPDEEADENAEVPRGEERNESPMRDSSWEETKADETLVASAAPASSTVTSCVWQPSTPLTQFIASDPARHFWQIAHTDYSTPNEMTNAVRAAIKEMNMMGDTMTRRDALCELASIPMIALGQKHTLHSKRYEEMLRFCTAALEGCWELHRSNDTQGRRHAFECVCTYVPILETIAHDSPRLKKQALDLAARYTILETLMSWTLASPAGSVNCAQHALTLSHETGNILLQLSARTKLAWTYLRNKNYVMGYQAIQEGEHVLRAYQRSKKGPSLPSGMIGNFNSSYALAQVHNGIDPDRALGIATDSKPLMGRIAFVEFTVPDQHFEAAKIYSLKGDSVQAMWRLGKLIDTETLALLPGVDLSEAERLSAVNTMTQSLLQSPERDLGRTIKAWTTVMEGAQTRHDEVMYDKAMTNFAIMRSFWPSERAVRSLMPLTSHW